MDAVKYIEEKERMCKSLPNCEGCPIRYTCDPTADEAREAVDAVEKWSKEHPKKTNGNKIWEMIPSYLRSTTTRLADSEAFNPNMITAKDYIELRIAKDRWYAEYKEERDD